MLTQEAIINYVAEQVVYSDLMDFFELMHTHYPYSHNHGSEIGTYERY